MVVANVLQLRCSLEESTSDLAKIDDADNEVILYSGGSSHPGQIAFYL